MKIESNMIAHVFQMMIWLERATIGSFDGLALGADGDAESVRDLQSGEHAVIRDGIETTSNEQRNTSAGNGWLPLAQHHTGLAPYRCRRDGCKSFHRQWDRHSGRARSQEKR